MKTITLFKFAVVAALVAVLSGCGSIKAAKNLEEGAWGTFKDIKKRWVESEGDIGWAVVWHRKVAEGVEFDDIIDTISNIAIETPGLMNVGSLPLSKELNGRGIESGILQIESFCNPETARHMVDFSPAMSAFLPCRIAIVEQEDGLHLYTLNMDMMVKMGRKMPPELKELTMAVRNAVWDMMEKASTGEF